MKKGLAVFSGSTPVHKLLQNGQVVLGTSGVSASVAVSGTLEVTGDLTVAANKLVIGANHPYTQTNLSGVLAEIKASIDDTAGAGSDISASLDDLRTVVSGVIGTDPAVFAGVLDSIQELTEYLDGDNSGSAIVNGIKDLTFEVSELTAALDSATVGADSGDVALTSSFDIRGGSNISTSIVAGNIQVDLDNDVTITGKLSASNVEASSEVKAVTVVSTGKITAGNQLEVSAGGAVINGTLVAKDNLVVTGSTTLKAAATLESSLSVTGVTTLTGPLTASAGAKISALTVDNNATIGGTLGVTGVTTLTGQLIASGGIDINGNLSGSGTLNIGGAATIAGTLGVTGAATLGGGLTVTGSAVISNGLTVAGGSAEVSHGTMKVIMVSGTDNLASLYAASGSSNGKFFYLQGAADGGFERGDCWYFCQGNEWFDAPFFGPEA